MALLAAHLRLMHETTPPEGVFAFDVEALADPAVAFFSARRDDQLLAVGALKRLDDGQVELKSMHTAATARGQGVGRALLDHLLATARQRGYRRVNLETGNFDAFAAARALYERAGFEVCAPFGPYVGSATSLCMTLELPA